MPHAAIPFRPYHRFAVPLPRSRRGGFSFTARQLLFPMRRMRAAAKYRRSEPIGAPMPHAALWVVQQRMCFHGKNRSQCFNAARGFVGGATVQVSKIELYATKFQCRTRLCGWCSRLPVNKEQVAYLVSMPHAALWVVQHKGMVVVVSFRPWFQCRTRLCGWCSFRLKRSTCFRKSSFNAARGFVGGATGGFTECMVFVDGFQCRTRLCGWCSCLFRSSALADFRFNAARGFVGGAASLAKDVQSTAREFQCRTRLCGWYNPFSASEVFCDVEVSMPHAALWVVQRSLHRLYHSRDYAK